MSLSISLHDVLDYDLERIRRFLEIDSSSINALDSSEDTPLLRILRNKKYSSVYVFQLLMNYGPDVNWEDRYGFSPLVIALQREFNEVFIKLLLEKGANINVQGPAGCSLICYALRLCTSTDVIQLLLDAGCPLSGCRSHSTALHCAIYNLRNRPMEFVLQLLIEKRADVNAVNSFGDSVLCFALGLGLSVSSIKMLLAAGGILNCTKHTNPLLCVTSHPCTASKASVIQFLLEQGACVNSNVLQGALDQYINEPKIIGLLLNHLQGAGAKDVVDGSNNTLLHLVVGNQHVKKSVVKLLIKQGVGVNKVNGNGDTALHEVVKKYGPSSVVKTLLKSGSQVNVENTSCETPLHLAMKHLEDADSDTLKLLFAAGARIGVTGHSMLSGVIEKCDFSLGMNLTDRSTQNRKLKCFKLLMKCYFLERPDFDFFQCLIPFHLGYYELKKFEFDCVRELQKLDSNIVGQDCTLKEFLRGYSPFQVGAANFGVDAKSIFDQLLRIIAENAFPLFLEILSAKVGRSAMKIKLQKLQVYTYLSDESRMGQKVVLNYDTVHKIGQLLKDDDLLRFISAFNKTDDHSCTGKVSKENILEDKRSDEHCHKCPRLDL